MSEILTLKGKEVQIVIVSQYIIPVIIMTIAAFCLGIMTGIRFEKFMQKEEEEMKKRQTIRGIPRKW